MNRIIVMGPPGVGKGTQAAILSEARQLSHITTGGIFRDHISRKTPLGLQVARTLDEGGFVADEITGPLLRDRLDEEDVAEGFILDGYPRTLAQVDALDEMLDARGTRIDGVVLFTAGDDVLTRRLLSRGGQRSDDRPDVIRRRLQEYKEQTAPLADHYDARGLLHRINATARLEYVAAAVALVVGRAVEAPTTLPTTAPGTRIPITVE